MGRIFYLVLLPPLLTLFLEHNPALKMFHRWTVPETCPFRT